MTRGVGLVLLACAICVASSAPVEADEAVAKTGLLTGTPREQAFQLYKMATEMFADEDFIAAAVTFGQAQQMLARLDRDATGAVTDKQAHDYRNAAMSNQATAYNRAGLYVEASATFSALREQFGKELSDTDRQEIDDAIAVAEAKIGTVMIVGLPEGEPEVRFDGRLERRDVRKPLRVPEGDHSIEVRASGFKPFVETFTVVGGKQLPLQLVLAPLTTPAALRVEATVASSRVEIDGKSLGIAPVEVSVTPGLHRIIVTSESYATQTTEFTLKPGERAIYRAAMVRAHAPLGVRIAPAFLASFPLRTDTPFGSFAGGFGLQVFHEAVRGRNVRVGASFQAYPRTFNSIGAGVVATWCPDRFAPPRGIAFCPFTASIHYLFGKDTERFNSGEGAAFGGPALELRGARGFARLTGGLRLENYFVAEADVGLGVRSSQLLLWSSVLEASIGLDL